MFVLVGRDSVQCMRAAFAMDTNVGVSMTALQQSRPPHHEDLASAVVLLEGVFNIEQPAFPRVR